MWPSDVVHTAAHHQHRDRKCGHQMSYTQLHTNISRVLAQYNQQQATFHNLCISVGRATCFRRFFHPSSGAQNCTYRPILLPAASLVGRLAAGSSIGLYVQFWAPDDGRKNHLKHVARPTETNKLWNVVSCWLYSANILALHGPTNVKPAMSLHSELLLYNVNTVHVTSTHSLVLTLPQDDAVSPKHVAMPMLYV